MSRGDLAMTNNLSIGTINMFSVNANKLNVTHSSPIRHSPPHIHDLCEIYVNLSGNVSFMVEKSLYSIQPGDIIITKPYEYHHCIYNDNSDHMHYWIMFSPDENPDIFDFFLERKRGKNNLIRLPKDISDRFLHLCEKIVTVNPNRSVSTISCFFELLAYIEQGLEKYNVTDINNNIPQNFNSILSHINKNFATIKSINELAANFNVSIVTLERYFKKYLSITPKRYLEDKKLSKACMLLRQNFSVTEACFECGFDDYSHFIAIFKKNFNTTPLKYQKHILNLEDHGI